MIQRVQSIYLLLAFLCMALLLFFPIFSVEVSSADGQVMLTGVFGKDGVTGEGLGNGSFPLSYVFIGLALFTLATLLMYKKAKRQLLMARLNLIAHVFLVLGIYGVYYLGRGFVADGVTAQAGEEVIVKFFMEAGFFLLIPTIAFIWLAIRGIKKDIQLLHSLDRLR